MTASQVRIQGINGAGILAFCEYADGTSIRVRYARKHRGRSWACDSCGRQHEPSCAHTIAVQHAVTARAALDHAEAIA